MNKKVGQKVYEMFQQVNKCITQMLKSLQYIYQGNGIKYNIQDKFDILTRILTPFQLLTYLDITNIQEILDSRSDVFWAVRSKPKAKEEYSFKMNYPKTCVSKGSGKIKKKELKNSMKNNFPLQNQKLVQDSLSISSYLFNSKKVQNETIKNVTQISQLSDIEERKICSWIVRQSKQRKRITKDDVLNQARVISCREDFPALQWFRIFILRHPELTQYFNKADKESLESEQSSNKDNENQSSKYQSERDFNNFVSKQKMEILKKKILNRNKKTSIFEESSSEDDVKSNYMKSSKLSYEDEL